MIEYKNKQYKLVAICTAGLQKEDVSDIVCATAESCTKLGFRTVVLNAFSDLFKDDSYSKGEAGIFGLAGSKLVDAVILMPEAIKNDTVCESIAEKAHARGVPVVSINGRIKGCTSISFNYGDSFEEIVRHVISVHKCSRINYVAGLKGNPFSEERTERYKAVLKEYGIPFDERRLGYGDFWEAPAERVAESWFESDLPLPEAVICANDSMAMAVCKVLKAHGLKVPQDIIVTGFDGIRLERYHTPRLTTASADPKDAGRAAAEAVKALLSGESFPEETEIPFRMRAAQSCGCHKIHNTAIADRIMELNTEMVGIDAHETYMFEYLSRALSCKSPKKLADVMKRYSHVETWCCLDSDFFGDSCRSTRFGALPACMQQLMTTEEEYAASGFCTEEILPHLPEILAEKHQLILSPLHNNAQFFGYTAFAIDIGYYDLRRARRFIMLTDQILETFKNRRTIELANEKLAEMHIRDPLTGVLNRRGFYKKASRMIRRLNTANGGAAIFSADMDGLKQINDSYGHALGDKAIKALAAALVKCSGENDICSRFGGDEFIIMSADTDEEHIQSFAGRVQQTLDDYVRRTRLPFGIKVSIGVISSRFSSAEGLDECIKVADEMMYKTKRRHKEEEQGRN
ncbi:MAG: GGDEF domain-containing protein [Ruminococcus sp.]|nr:GGDEF domain-containing protein [Ruminococcus sp.]